MQDDKFNIQKLLQDDPDEIAEPVNADQDTDQDDASEVVEDAEEIVADDAEEVVEPVNTDQDIDQDDTVESDEEAEEVVADDAEEVVEPVNADQDTDQDDTVESDEEAEEVAEPEVMETAVKKKPQPEPETPAEPLSPEEKKQRAMKVLMAVLMVGFGFVAKKSFFPSPKESMAQKVQPAQAVETNTMPQWQLPEEYPSSLRDPMRFGSVSGGQYDVEPESLVLRGIIFSSTPSAIINGKIVRAGDEILGATVVEIKRESVVFRSGDQQWEQKVKR